jgi:putative peptidoglycan lipid II flippase
MRLIRSAISVGFFTILSRIAGFAREWLQAHYIGASAVSDALGYAISFPSFFRRVFAEGAFNASFVPLFSSTLAAEGKVEAQKFGKNALSLLTISLLIVVILFEIFADTLMPLCLPGLKDDPERLILTTSLTRITFPFLLFISLNAFYSGVLNSFERFVAAASSPMIGNIAVIFFLVGLVSLGVDAGKSLALGVFGCGVIQFIWVYLPARKEGIKISLHWPEFSPKLKTFLRRMLPGALGSGVVQVNLIVDMVLSSYLPTGSYSYLKYADRFNQLPLSVIGTAISTALLPMLSRQLRQGNLTEASDSQNRALEFSLFFVLPATAGLIFLSQELVSSFYEHGKFTTVDILPTAHTLVALASGLPAYVLVKVFSTSFFSRGDTRTPVVLAVACVFLNFFLNLAFIWAFHQVGMALATSLASWFNVIMLGIILRRRNFLHLDQKMKRFLPRILVATIILGAFLKLAGPYIIEISNATHIWQWFLLICVMGIGGIVYILSAYILGIFSWTRIKEHLSKDSSA